MQTFSASLLLECIL